MTVMGLHLHDAALAVASEGSLISVLPSIIHADSSNREALGRAARDVSRVAPHLVSSEHWATIARNGTNSSSAVFEAARAELRARVDRARVEFAQRDGVVECAVSAVFSAESLGVVLALARLEGLRIRNFHDSAALAVASLGLSGTTLVLELGLSHVLATRVEVRDGEARHRAAAIRRGIGVAALQQSWLRMISEAMVLRTRFDPLHEGSSEQRLYDLLDATAAAAAETGSAELELPTGREPARVTLSRDQFVEAALHTYREIQGVLHELRPAGARINVLIDESLLRLPGMIARLAELRGCRVFTMPTGFIARAASLAGATVDTASADEGDTVTLQRGYALGVPLENPTEVDLSGYMPVDTMPTHALFEGRAFTLPREGILEIGRVPAASGIRLAEGSAGVSRLHCSLRADRTGVSLIAHSPCGTWLNEEAVGGRVRVQAGDRLRIGTPGVVIEFIAVGGSDSGAS